MIIDTSYGIIPYYQDEHAQAHFLLIYQKEGFRGFPKGHLEAGETPQQAALRELYEETGLQNCQLIAPEQDFSFEYTFINRKGQTVLKTAHYQIGKLEPSQHNQVAIDQHEVINFQRCTQDEALQLLTHKNSKDCLLAAVPFIQ